MLNIVAGNIVEAGIITFMTLIIVFGANLLKPGLTALLVVLLCIEIFQLMVSIKRYFFQFENWIENATIALGFIILYNDKSEFELCETDRSVLDERCKSNMMAQPYPILVGKGEPLLHIVDPELVHYIGLFAGTNRLLTTVPTQ